MPQSGCAVTTRSTRLLPAGRAPEVWRDGAAVEAGAFPAPGLAEEGWRGASPPGPRRLPSASFPAFFPSRYSPPAPPSLGARGVPGCGRRCGHALCPGTGLSDRYSCCSWSSITVSGPRPSAGGASAARPVAALRGEGEVRPRPGRGGLTARRGAAAEVPLRFSGSFLYARAEASPLTEKRCFPFFFFLFETNVHKAVF